MRPPPTAEVLPLLLARLWARYRARGAGSAEAAEQAAVEAARLLACDIEMARAVMAEIPRAGRGRPL